MTRTCSFGQAVLGSLIPTDDFTVRFFAAVWETEEQRGDLRALGEPSSRPGSYLEGCNINNLNFPQNSFLCECRL